MERKTVKTEFEVTTTNAGKIFAKVGEIFREDLISNIEFYDNRYQKEIKQWSRNKSLEEIGI